MIAPSMPEVHVTVFIPRYMCLPIISLRVQKKKPAGDKKPYHNKMLAKDKQKPVEEAPLDESRPSSIYFTSSP